MKSINWILTSLVAVTVFVAGCSKSEQSTTVDPTPVEKSFASADPSVKATADKAVSEIKAQNYQGALTELQKLSANAKLTDDQKQAITDVIANIKKAISEAVEKAKGEANKAMENMQKSIGK